MTIKDFKVGQTAYILGDGSYRDDGKAKAAEITKVGRRYVTVKESERQETRFFMPAHAADYLFEDKVYGAKRILFATAEAVDDYNELIGLRVWVMNYTNWLKVKEYTLAQLRAVKKILEGDDRG